MVNKLHKWERRANASVSAIWIIWLAAATLSFAVYWPSLTLTKHIWQDEVQILEFGRVLFPGADLSHSMAWKIEESRAAMSLSYLGPALQEVAYRIFAPAIIGARVSAIIGGIVASGAMLAWLVSVGVMRPIALACSLVLLWDPIFVEGYRGARVDSWCIAFVVIGLLLISVGRKARAPSYWPSWWELSAGIAIAISGLIWVSAVLLLPLVALQCLYKSPCGPQGSIGRRVAGLIWVGVFAAIFCALLLWPVASFLHAVLSDNNSLIERRVTAPTNWRGLVEPFLTRSPWLPLCAVIGIIYMRAWGLMLAFVAALSAVLLTGAYSHRNVYLLPYLLLAVATSASCFLSGTTCVRARYAAIVVILTLMLVWSAGLSLGARTLIAWKEREFRDPDLLRVLLRDKISPHPLKAYLAPYELYYAARELGWQTFKGYHSEDWEDSGHRALVSSMDVVVQRADGTSQKLDDLMLEQGFTSRKIAVGPGPAPRQENYGEYIVYLREAGTD